MVIPYCSGEPHSPRRGRCRIRCIARRTSGACTWLIGIIRCAHQPARSHTGDLCKASAGSESGSVNHASAPAAAAAAAVGGRANTDRTAGPGFMRHYGPRTGAVIDYTAGYVPRGPLMFLGPRVQGIMAMQQENAMRKLATILTICVVSACTTLIAQTPSTMPTTAPATQPAKRLGIRLMDENLYEGGQGAIRSFGGNLVVNDVLPGSRAEKMGLKVGDAIKRINDKEMSTTDDVLSAVRDADLLKIDVIR